MNHERFDIPGQLFLHRLTQREGFELWRTQVKGVEATTRVFTDVVLPIQLRATLAGVASGRIAQVAGLNDRLMSALVGFSLRARLGELSSLPPVLEAGLVAEGGVGDRGHPYVSVAWVPGATLKQVGPNQHPRERERVLLAVLEILVHLHTAKIAFGDLKPANIVIDGSRVSLIDLETMREVPDTDVAAPAGLATLEYAAPEVSESHLIFLASDLYSFGRTVERVLGEADGAPPEAPWREVAAACMRRAPLDRPRAGDVLAFLRGRRADLPAWSGAPVELPTTRVPDEPEPSVGVEIRSPTPIRPGGSGGPHLLPGRPWTLFLLMPLLLGGALGLIGLAAGALWREAKVAEADRAAVAVLTSLAERQTDAKQNRSVKLDELATQARWAAQIWKTPTTLGVVALTEALSSEWHYSNRTRWDNERWRADKAALDEALTAETTPAAQLAATYVYLAVCKLDPKGIELSTDEACRQLSDTADRLHTTGDLPRWMWIEAQWAAIIGESRQALRVQSSDPERALSLRKRTMGRCEAGLLRFRDGVNAEELLQDCLEVAQVLEDFSYFLRAADALLRIEEARGGGGLGDVRVGIIRAVDPLCEKKKVALTSLRPPPPQLSTEGQRLALCRYLGAAAIGCPNEASVFRPCVSYDYFGYYGDGPGCLVYASDPQVPWDKAADAILSPIRTSCPL